MSPAGAGRRAAPPPKTNAMRALDARGVAYEVFAYDAAIHGAVEAAGAMGVPPARVYKTLVCLTAGGRAVLVMAPGDAEVDLRRLARSLGEKAVRFAPQREAERLTGLRVGGIGALALLGRPFDVALDGSALGYERIWVNPGRRGVNVAVAVDDLIRVTGARIVDAVAGPPAT